MESSLHKHEVRDSFLGVKKIQKQSKKSYLNCKNSFHCKMIAKNIYNLGIKGKVINRQTDRKQQIKSPQT